MGWGSVRRWTPAHQIGQLPPRRRGPARLRSLPGAPGPGGLPFPAAAPTSRVSGKRLWAGCGHSALGGSAHSMPREQLTVSVAEFLPRTLAGRSGQHRRWAGGRPGVPGVTPKAGEPRPHCHVCEGCLWHHRCVWCGCPRVLLAEQGVPAPMAPRHPGSSGVPRAQRVTLGRHAMSCLRGLGASWPCSRAGFETLGLFLSDVTRIQLCRLEPPSSTVCAGGCPAPAAGTGVSKGQWRHPLWLGHCHCCAVITVTAVPLSSSLLHHSHCHCCVMVTLIPVQCHCRCHCCVMASVSAVQQPLSLLCHGHPHCCALSLSAVSWPLSLLCPSHCHGCVMCVIVTVSAVPQSLSLLCQGHCVVVTTAQCHPSCASHHSHPSDIHLHPLPPSSSSSCPGHLPRSHRGSIPISHPCHPPLIPLPGCVWFGTGQAGAGVNPAWKPKPAAGEGLAKANTGKGGLCVV